MKLMYRTTECTPVRFISAVAACSGAAESDTFDLVIELIHLFRFPEITRQSKRKYIAEQVDRVTYGVCKMEDYL